MRSKGYISLFIPFLYERISTAHTNISLFSVHACISSLPPTSQDCRTCHINIYIYIYTVNYDVIKALKAHTYKLGKLVIKQYLLPHLVPWARGLPQEEARRKTLSMSTICSISLLRRWHTHGMSTVLTSLQHASDGSAMVVLFCTYK